jgi:hypothetical protein
MAGGQPVAVVARDAKGGELKGSIVDGGNKEAVAAQAATLQKQFPEATIAIEPPEKAVQERQTPVAVSGAKPAAQKPASAPSTPAEAPKRTPKPDKNAIKSIQQAGFDYRGAAKTPEGGLEYRFQDPQNPGVEARVAHGSEITKDVLAQKLREARAAAPGAQPRDDIRERLKAGSQVVLEDGTKGEVLATARPGHGDWVRVKLRDGGEANVPRAKVRTPNETLSANEREDRARVAIEAAGYEFLGGEDAETGRVARYRDKETGAVARHKLMEAPTATRLREGVDRANELARKTLDFEVREEADGTFRVYGGDGKQTDITAALPAEAEKKLREAKQVRNVKIVRREQPAAAAEPRC